MWRKGKKLAQVARLWALGQLYIPDQDGPDEVIDDAAAALGLYIVPSDASEPLEDTCYLWPCNVPVKDLWNELQTQWVWSWRGREGLNYEAVIRYMREVAHIRRRKFDEYFGCIQAMERAALKAWDEQRK